MERRRGVRVALVLALVAVLLAACRPAGPDGILVETVALEGSTAVGVVARDAPPVALVVYLHGMNEDHRAVLADSPLGWLVHALVEAGYAVVAGDAGGNSFGSPAAQREYAALARLGADRYGTNATFLLAESMGGLAAIPLAASGAVPDLLGTAGISPAISLTATSGDDHRAAIEEAWGRVPDAGDDPLGTPLEALAGQSFRFYVAIEDTSVPTADHAGAFAARFRDVADVTLVRCGPGHVDASCYQPDDVVAWFGSLLAAAAARPTSVENVSRS